MALQVSLEPERLLRHLALKPQSPQNLAESDLWLHPFPARTYV